jgi:hypothetical protein
MPQHGKKYTQVAKLVDARRSTSPRRPPGS